MTSVVNAASGGQVRLATTILLYILTAEGGLDDGTEADAPYDANLWNPFNSRIGFCVVGQRRLCGPHQARSASE
jgi:hypothetical protein